MSTHVVVVNWNGGDEVLRAVEAARGSEPPAVIHVVDNGSTDGSAERLEALDPEIRLQRTGANLGFAKAANRGIRAALDAGADFVFLLNSDAVVREDTIDALVQAVQRHPEAGLFAGKIVQDGAGERLWCCGVKMGFWPNLARLRGHGRRDRGRYDREELVDALTGCGLLVARAVFERIGLLDEGYFVYVEDADFCARAAKAGLRCCYVPTSVMVHRGAGSTGGGYSEGRKYLSAHGSVRYLRDHGTPSLWLGFLVLDLALYPVVVLLGSLRGRLSGVLAKGRGLRDGLLGRPADRGVVEGR